MMVTVSGVTWHENNTRTIEFTCPCGLVHRMPWAIGYLQIGRRVAPCGAEVDIEIPDWAYGTRSYRQPRNSLNDNAIHAPLNDWEE